MMKRYLVLLCSLLLAVLFSLYSWHQYWQAQQTISEYAVSETASKQMDTSSISKEHPFEFVLPNRPVRLPQDFNFHQGFEHEWWHYFANVSDEHGQQYGIQWSYFRLANEARDANGWLSPQLYLAYVVISSKNEVWREQRIARGGIGQAGLELKPFKMWIDNWNWRAPGTTPFPGVLDVATDTFSLSLKNNLSGPFVLPGQQGYQKKHDSLSLASYSLQAPFLQVKGVLNLGVNSQPIQVTGNAWLSKEWGNNLLPNAKQGWDKLFVKLDSKTTLLVDRYRYFQQEPYLFGAIVKDSGTTIALSADEIDLVPVVSAASENERDIPLQWVVNIPKYNIHLVTKAVNRDLWSPFLLPYWEGPIITDGSHKVTGFMQLTSN